MEGSSWSCWSCGCCTHAHELPPFHISFSSCRLRPTFQLPPPCLAPHLRLREELTTLLVLDVGDLTVLYLRINSEAVVGSVRVQAPQKCCDLNRASKRELEGAQAHT